MANINSTNSKIHALSMDRDKGKPGIHIYDNIRDLSIRSFYIIAMTPRGTLALGYLHIAQLMTQELFQHFLILQSCYKPVGIPHN